MLDDSVNFIDPAGLEAGGQYSPTDPENGGLTLLGVVPLVIGEIVQGGSAAAAGISAAWRWLFPVTPVIQKLGDACPTRTVDLTNLSDKIIKSMEKRGWTVEMIQEAVKLGQWFKAN